MAPGGGWDEAVAKNLEAAFTTIASAQSARKARLIAFGKCARASAAEEFQEFIDGPNGVNFGLGAWLNICREINLELADLPYPRKF